MIKNFFFTIDTEIDKSLDWSIANKNHFNSINYGIKKLLFPLLEKHNIKSTFLISPEVLNDSQSVLTLKDIKNKNMEYGTHLHSEFIEPERVLFINNMSGQFANKFQNEYTKNVEYKKLKNLTNKFIDVFNYQPISFRAGRYAKSKFTDDFLIDLNYEIDSSVTPGLKWYNNKAVIDYSKYNNNLLFTNKKNKKLISIPISIHNKNIFFNRIFFNDNILNKLFKKLLPNLIGYDWLRPAYNNNYNLEEFFHKYNQNHYVLIMHSNELSVNTSPYIKNNNDLKKLLKSLDNLFTYINKNKIKSLNLKDLKTNL